MCTVRFSHRWWLSIAIVLFPGWVLGASLQHFTVKEWPSTTYYLGFPYFGSAAKGRIRITAGGRYTLYLNGDLIGADEDPLSVETYAVSFKKRENTVAVVVEYSGANTGYGLFCVLDAEGVLLVSSPTDRTTPWFWTGYPLENKAKAAWTKLRSNKLEKHQKNGEPVTWRGVQAGTLDPRAFPEFGDLDLTRASSVAGFPGGLDGSRGGLRLRSLQGQNFAYGASSTEPKLIDGDVRTPKAFSKGVAALGQWVEIDLLRPYLVNRVRVITQPPSKGTYEDVSLRGYSIRVSKDGVNYLDVGSRNQITTYQESSVSFPTIPARYVRLTITEFANRNASPRVGEMEVYGEGVAQQGSYLSPPLNLGTNAPKNFGRVQWFGETSAETDLDLQFRSSDDGITWSPWSPRYQKQEIELTVPEPRRYLQFQATMRTRNLYVGPRLDSLRVFYSIGPFPASQALGAISPTRFHMGVDTTFTYTLRLDVQDGDAGVSRLVIPVPWPAQFDSDHVQGLGTVVIDRDYTYSTNDSLVIAFNPPIRSTQGTVELVFPFQTRLLSASYTFQGVLYGMGGSSPLLVQGREGTDPDTGLPYTMVAEATDLLPRILKDVQAYPALFSPNGDGVHDDTVLGFTLSKVSDIPVHIEISDLRGALVRRLWKGRLDAGRYAPVGDVRFDLPGYWDGRDDAGELLPPGSYLYHIIADVDPEAETAVGVVSLIY